eukprot:SAG11_NODE_938_length_6471_cov_4.156780_4_plen_46_part_00
MFAAPQVDDQIFLADALIMIRQEDIQVTREQKLVEQVMLCCETVG